MPCRRWALPFRLERGRLCGLVQLPRRQARFVGPGSLLFQVGTQKAYDLVLPCTGQRPNSGILSNLMPSAIDPQTRQILVHPTLQVKDGSGSEKSIRIFSLGDIAKQGGPRFARAARAQAEIVTSNILSLVNGHRDRVVEYRPAMYESAIKLTLGKDNFVFCGRTKDGQEIMKFGQSQNEDSELLSAWGELGAALKKDADSNATPPLPFSTNSNRRFGGGSSAGFDQNFMQARNRMGGFGVQSRGWGSRNRSATQSSRAV